MAKEPLGRPKTLVRRHVLEIKKDTRDWLVGLGDDLLNQHTAFPKARVAGAAFAAAGTYGLVALMVDTAKKPLEAIQDLHAELAKENPDSPAWALALGTFGDLGFMFLNLFGAGIQKKPDVDGGGGGGGGGGGSNGGGGASEIEFGKIGLHFDPIAFSASLMAGGLVLAGQNPGEVLKGIGSIIDALIPL